MTSARIPALLSDIQLHKPFSVGFVRDNGRRYTYTIDCGGLRATASEIIHGTPEGSFTFDQATSWEAVTDAADRLGAHITEWV